MLEAKPTIHQYVLKHQNLSPRPDPDTFSPLSTFNIDLENLLALEIPFELLWTVPGLAAVLKLPRTGRLLTRRGAPAVPQTPTNPQLISNPSCQPDNALCPSCCSNFFSPPGNRAPLSCPSLPTNCLNPSRCLTTASFSPTPHCHTVAANIFISKIS